MRSVEDTRPRSGLSVPVVTVLDPDGELIDSDQRAVVRHVVQDGYGADVVEPEPIEKTNPLLGAPNVVLTPHTGSRTYESVERQAMVSEKREIAADALPDGVDQQRLARALAGDDVGLAIGPNAQAQASEALTIRHAPHH